MKTFEQLFLNAIEHWKENKGIGTALIPYPLEDKLMVLGVLQRIYNRSPTTKTVIIVNDFKERTNILEFLSNQPESEENNKEFKELIQNGNIKVFTINYLRSDMGWHHPDLAIWYKPEQIDIKIFSYVTSSKFKLIILDKLLISSKDMTLLYKSIPLLSDFKQIELDEARVNTPVKEFHCPVQIPKDSDDEKLLQTYNEYISTSISIFGSFDILNQLLKGNNIYNISANQICYNIAVENGWNEHLDMSIPFNVEIDRLYNPMNLKDRASTTYEIIRNRSQFLSNYNGKLSVVLDIIKENLDKKILIISKRSSFATAITKYINNNSENNICLNYHDAVDNIPAINIDGIPITIKSGPNKGKQKIMGATAQKTYATTLFNNNKINVLSANNAVDKKLNIDIDIIIITSPMCEEIKNYLYRLSNIRIPSGELIVYTIYCQNTQEQKLMEARNTSLNVIVKNNSDKENNFDFVIDD